MGDMVSPRSVVLDADSADSDSDASSRDSDEAGSGSGDEAPTLVYDNSQAGELDGDVE